jgi:hypothetical protein
LAQALERETEARRAEVSQTLAGFSKNLARTARRTKADRLGSLSELKRTVSGLRTEVHTDLSSVRQAWRALNTPSHGAEEKLTSRARQETEANLERSQSERKGQPRPIVGGGEKPPGKKRKH